MCPASHRAEWPWAGGGRSCRQTEPEAGSSRGGHGAPRESGLRRFRARARVPPARLLGVIAGAGGPRSLAGKCVPRTPLPGARAAWPRPGPRSVRPSLFGVARGPGTRVDTGRGERGRQRKRRCGEGWGCKEGVCVTACPAPLPPPHCPLLSALCPLPPASPPPHPSPCPLLFPTPVPCPRPHQDQSRPQSPFYSWLLSRPPKLPSLLPQFCSPGKRYKSRPHCYQ